MSDVKFFHTMQILEDQCCNI